MHKKQNHIYIGIDLHKATHTAVIIDCWNTKLGEITFENKPSEFKKLIAKVNKHSEGLIPVFGLENAESYGRNLAIYLIEKGYIVKDVNPSLSHAQRLSAPTTKKDDSYDAWCVSNVLLSRLDDLPEVKPNDIFWTLAQLVNRRESIVVTRVRLKGQLHEQLSHNYASYKKFFTLMDTKTALNFWELYPSPQYLQGVTVEELAEIMRKTSHNHCSTKKAQSILDAANNDGYIKKDYQEARDFIIKGIVRDLRHAKEELEKVEKEIIQLMKILGYKLETMPGIDTITAARIVAEIGDINRFSNADKLARFAGIAPSFFGSGGKGKEQKSRQGNRRLYGIFYFLAVQMIQVSIKGKPRNAVFLDFFKRKQTEGKTKPQALVSVMRRLVNIIYGMLKNKTEYKAPEVSNKEVA